MSMRRNRQGEMGSTVKQENVVTNHRGFEIMLLAEGLFAIRNPEGYVLKWRGLSREDAVEYLEISLRRAEQARERVKAMALNFRYGRKKW